ncbi:MAG TPA: SurA N-terminal domain-containing protein [Stellaceae bacterium]|jgi:peptidyl-prolyl cis-trans isomerase D|nr:SurA N-terminal domain-containing protein [Stellaceae bacterium]
MLQAIRTRAGGIIVKVLFGLLILSFGFWGLYTKSPFFQDKSADTVVATVGDQDIHADTVQATLQPVLERLRAQVGGDLDADKKKNVVDAVVAQLVDRDLLGQEVTRLHLDLSDEVIRNAIMSNPAFVGPDGRFNRDQFNQALAANRMTEDQLIGTMRRDISRGDLLQSMTAGVVVPRPVIDAVYRFRNETRVADVVAVPLSIAGNIPAPTDDQVAKFYQDNQDMFRAEEYRSFTLASLAISDLTGAVTITDDKLKAAYDDRKEDFQLPEERDVQQILAPTEDKAKAVEAALASGEDFQKAATEIAGQDPSTIDLGLVKPDDLPKELGDAAFTLPVDKPSEPMKTELGWHILRVVKIQAPQTLSFDQAKDQLQKQLVEDEAADRLDKIANDADDALAGGAALSDVAAKYGLKLITVDGVDASGRTPDGKVPPLPIGAKDVLKAVFETETNQTSRITPVEDAAIFAVHVDKIVPPVVKPLADVKAQAVIGWNTQQRQDAVKKIASDLTAAVSSGTPLAQAASAKGLGVATSPPLSRRAQGALPLPKALIGKLFTAKIGDTETGGDDNGTYVAQLKTINIPQSTPDDQVKALTAEIGNSMRYDMAGEFTDSLKKRYPVTIKHDVLDKMF